MNLILKYFLVFLAFTTSCLPTYAEQEIVKETKIKVLINKLHDKGIDLAAASTITGLNSIAQALSAAFFIFAQITASPKDKLPGELLSLIIATFAVGSVTCGIASYKLGARALKKFKNTQQPQQTTAVRV